MTLYLDASALLRIVFGQPGAIVAPETERRVVTSGLTEVESLRTIDRLRLSGVSSPDRLPEFRSAVYGILAEAEVVDVSPAVLRRAGQAFPVPLGTLDAIHLSTALLWSEHLGDQPVMATHDHQLALAARASGLNVVGV